MAFLDDYEPVADRIAKFWAKYGDNGRILTEIKLINETEVVVQASVYIDKDDQRPAAIDWAHETRGSSNINRASFLENCSTSAIGRALATLGFSTKKRASREEMLKVTREHRNYLIEAQEAYENQDLETLRTIYAAAVKATVDNETLEAIKSFAEKLKK